jgi:hypothetical protein
MMCFLGCSLSKKILILSILKIVKAELQLMLLAGELKEAELERKLVAILLMIRQNAFEY